MVKRDIQNIQNNDLIDLKEAAKHYDYTQHHFGLLCRQGKLKAERVGKKWFTTRDWIEEYLGKVEEKYKKTAIHYTQQPRPSRPPLPPRVEIPPIKLPPLDFIPTPLAPYITGLRLVLGSAFAVIFAAFLYFGFLQAVTFDYVKLTRDLFEYGEKTSLKVAYFVEEPPQSVSVFLGNTQNNFFDFSKDIKNLNLSSVASASLSLGEFTSATKDNLLAFGRDIKKWASGAKRFAWGIGRAIKMAFLDRDAGRQGEGELVYKEPELPEAKEGMVVLPESFGDMGDEELKREIQDVFSDKVVVKPDEEGDAGIIQPIFKKGKGEEYLYVMVPVDKEKDEQ